MVHMTGGLPALYKRITKIRSDNGCKEVPMKAEDQLLLEKSDVEKVPITKFYLKKKLEEEKQKQIEAESKDKESDGVDKKDEQSDGVEKKDNESDGIDEMDKESDDVDKKVKKSDSEDKNDIKSDDVDKKDKELNGDDKDKDLSSIQNGVQDEEMSEKEDECKNSVASKETSSSKEEKKESESEMSGVKDEGINNSIKNTDDKIKNPQISEEENKENKNDCEDDDICEIDDKDSKSPDDESPEKKAKSDSDSDDKSVKDGDEDSDDEEDEEEEETTEFTDEDGEFVPVPGMPLLANRYKYLQVLGRGQSALIIKVEDTFCKCKQLAIKVLHRVYKPIGSQEADILLELQRADPYFHVPFARVKTQFLYGPHYCLVFESLLPTPLYTYYDQKDIRGAPALPYIRQLAVKLLTVIGFLQKQNVIHADLKPENILLRKENDLNSIMVVDFGNALRNTEEELSLYYSDFELQTLLYRAPEVIFGLRFSLEVDMWSLGCLLAECYIGKPLFFGKTKEEILSKIVKLLGPFPKEFSEGMCGEEFAEFIGRPLSRFQRIENLTKRLNKCTNMPFLLILERMLTYLPEERVVPAEAACHPFVAHVTPFLYLTLSPGEGRYPTIVLDSSTYPHRPEHLHDDEEDPQQASCRKRLLSFAHSRLPKLDNNPANQTITTTTASDNVLSINRQTKTVSVAPTSSSQAPVSRSDVKETLKSMGLRCEDFTISVYSKEQAHAILRKQGVEVTNHVPSNQKQMQSNTRGANSRDVMRSSSGSNRNNQTRNRGGSSAPPPPAPPPDDDDDDDDCVILDPPVSNNPRPQPAKPRLPQQFQLMGTTVQVNRGAKRPYSGPQNPMGSKRPSMVSQFHNTSVNYHHPQQYRQMQQQQQQQRFSSAARQRQYQQQQQMLQQQYMDDYSDEEDSGGESSVQDTLKRLKNYNISITCRRNEQQQSTRHNSMSNRHMGNSRHMSSSVSATFHPHARHNMSRQSGQQNRGQHVSRTQHVQRQGAMGRQNVLRSQNMHMLRANMMRDDSDYDDEQMMDSEDEADLGNYLECEIGEEDNVGHMVEGDEELHFDDDEDHLEEGEIRRPNRQGDARRPPGNSSNPAKGKYSHLATKKRSSAPPVQSEEADTSIEEVVLSHGSEADNEPMSSKPDQITQKKPDKGAEDEDMKDGDEDRDSAAESEKDEDGGAESVDNMLERHLHAVCGSSDGEQSKEEEEGDEMTEPQADGSNDEPQQTSDNGKSVEDQSPFNEEALLGEVEEEKEQEKKKDSGENESADVALSQDDNNINDDDEIDEELEKELLAGEG